jgi:hypothetical protein
LIEFVGERERESMNLISIKNFRIGVQIHLGICNASPFVPTLQNG